MGCVHHTVKYIGLWVIQWSGTFGRGYIRFQSARPGYRTRSQKSRRTEEATQTQGQSSRSRRVSANVLHENCLTDLSRGTDREAVRFPPPPPYVPVETQRIGAQIGLLRSYYNARITALIPLPPPRPVVPVLAPPTPRALTPPVPVPTESAPVEPSSPPQETSAPAPIFDPYNPSALFIQVPKITPTTASTTSAPPKAPSPGKAADMELAPIDGTADFIVPDEQMAELSIPLEMLPVLEDDGPDPSRVKVGPLGQIQVPSAATVAKQKRQHKAAAQAKAAAVGPPGTPVATTIQSPVSASKPKKTTPKKPKSVTAPSS